MLVGSGAGNTGVGFEPDIGTEGGGTYVGGDIGQNGWIAACHAAALLACKFALNAAPIAFTFATVCKA